MDATTLVYNTADRLVRLIEDNALKAEYVYNGRGQRVIKKHAGDTAVYHYDLSGNLIAISDRHGAIKEKFIYANGQRLAKIAVAHQALNVGDVDQNGQLELHDAQLVEQYLVGLATLTQSQLAQADVTLDGKVTAPDAMTIKQIVNGLHPLPLGPAQETLYYYHNDHLGTPLALTDQDGVNVWQADYLPFGQVYQQTGTVAQAFRFAGQHFDSETGLHYNYYRYYDPKIGRYLRADPIRLDESINPYSYVQNNPVMFVDPYGLWSFTDMPSFSEAFPNSNYAAPMADIVAGGIELGVSATFGTAGVISLAAGPEFWPLAATALPTAAATGWDGQGRIRTGIECLGNGSNSTPVNTNTPSSSAAPISTNNSPTGRGSVLHTNK